MYPYLKLKVQNVYVTFIIKKEDKRDLSVSYKNSCIDFYNDFIRCQGYLNFDSND